MKKLLFIFGLLALTAHAETVDIGGTQINLPSPKELVKVTPDMNEIFEFLEEVNNIQFSNAWVIASYISLQDLQENKDYVRLCRINIVKDGINGLLVDNNNQASLEDAMSQLLKNSTLRNALQLNSKKSVENLNIKNISKRWLSL